MTYKEIACKCCSLPFVPRSSRQKHCSPECRFRAIAADFSGEDCWEWPLGMFKSTGYGQFAVTADKPETAHRMAYRVFVADPGGSFVCHRCDNRRCFNPAHLFLGTHQENVADMMAKGRYNSDRARPGNVRSYKPTKLSMAQALAIAQAAGSSRQIGQQYGVDHKTVLNIWNRFGTTADSGRKTELLAQSNPPK